MSFEQVLEKIPKDSWLVPWMRCWPLAESPKSFILLSGLTALGACLGRGVWFVQDFFTLYPMLNILCIGPSGVGKTAALEYMALPLVRKMPQEFRPQLLEGKTTPQKLMADLALQPHAVLYAEELAALFTKEKFMESMIPCVCLVPDTPVLTANLEWKPVGELAIGETIVGFDEHNGGQGKDRKFRKAAVVANGRKRLECVRILTDKGSIDCSLEHGFLVKEQNVDVWKQAQEIKVGQELRWFGEPWEQGQTIDDTYLSGLMDGEGSITPYHVYFTQQEGLVLNRCKELLTRNGYFFREYKKFQGSNCYNVRIGRGIYQRLKFMGTTRSVRLLPKADKLWDGFAISKGGRGIERAKVLGIVSLGMQDTVPLETTTSTIIAGGFFTHNTKLLNYLERQEERTKTGDSVVVDRPSVTVCGGSTPEWLQDQLPDSATSGGFLARFLICYEQYKGQRVALPRHSMSRTKWHELLESREATFRDFQSLITQKGEMDFDGYEASDVYVEWYNNLKPIAGHLAPFAARGGEFVIRLGMLIALSRNSLLIQAEDLEAGIAIWDYCNNKLNEVVVPMSGKGKLLAQILKVVGNQEVSDQMVCRLMRNYGPTQEVQQLITSHLMTGELVRVEGKLKRSYSQTN